jgi:uncharacterized protein (DUF2062 family)
VIAWNTPSCLDIRIQVWHLLPSMSRPRHPHPHGLHTVHELNWLGRQRLALRRRSRALYRHIRHPKHRHRNRFRRWLAHKIRNRNLWHANRNAVASGLGWGLFIGMLPVPLQSLIAAALGMARGWNLPATVFATWLSNPFTYVPMLVGAKYSVTGAFAIFGKDCAASRLSLARMRDVVEAAAHFRFSEAWHMAGTAVLEILAGLVILGAILGLIGWLAVQVSWRFFERKPAVAYTA